jgi:hypothetical protein
MAFQFVDPGDDYDLIEEDGDSYVLAYVGGDPATGCTYFVAATLSPFNDCVEYSFSVIERCNGNDRQFTSGLETKGLFGKADRSAILSVIGKATEILLDWKRAPVVDRCTSDANPPSGALWLSVQSLEDAAIKSQLAEIGTGNSFGGPSELRRCWTKSSLP